MSPNRPGWAFAANTGVIVIGQLLVLRQVGGRSRSRVLALAAAIWSLSWVVITSSGLVDGAAAVACAVIGLGLFGVGGTLWAPVAPALVNELAVEELRGRYNALQSMVWTVSSILGPSIAGLLIGTGHSGVWAVTVIGGTAAAALLFLRLRGHLTPTQDGGRGRAYGVRRHPLGCVDAARHHRADADPGPWGQGHRRTRRSRFDRHRRRVGRSHGRSARLGRALPDTGIRRNYRRRARLDPRRLRRRAP